MCYYSSLMRTILRLLLLFLLMLPSAVLSAEKGMTVSGVRYFSYPAFTRIVFEIDSPAPYVLTKASDNRSYVFTAYNMPLIVKAQLPVIRDGVVSGLEVSKDSGRTALIVHLDTAAGAGKDFVLRAPDRIVLDISRGAAPPTPLPQAGKAIVVVLDPGHGGRDTGIVTAKGQEKSFTLAIAHAVKNILQKDPRVKVVLTRDKDQALSLDERAALANTAGASIFVSIHGAPDANTQVYLQDLSDDSAPARSRSISGDFLGFESGNEQQGMLWGRQQAAHAQESGGLGRRLARQLTDNDHAEPIQAPLAELKAVDAAAVLVEIGMLTDRSRAAGAIAGGIEQYARENR
jgi:N-acetylmuramoyl-L-alanine amidase